MINIVTYIIYDHIWLTIYVNSYIFDFCSWVNFKLYLLCSLYGKSYNVIISIFMFSVALFITSIFINDNKCLISGILKGTEGKEAYSQGWCLNSNLRTHRKEGGNWLFLVISQLNTFTWDSHAHPLTCPTHAHRNRCKINLKGMSCENTFCYTFIFCFLQLLQVMLSPLKFGKGRAHQLFNTK